MKKAKKYFIITLTLLMLVSMVAPAVLADISKSKTASVTDLSTTGTETVISLALPDNQSTVPIDIVFVLDKSASQDNSALIDEAKDLVDVLAAKTNLDVDIAMVEFSSVATIRCPLTPLTPASAATIKNSLTTIYSSGTNLHGGLLTAKAILDGDATVEPENKYIILLTDGGSTYYTNNEGKAVRMRTQRAYNTSVADGPWQNSDIDPGATNGVDLSGYNRDSFVALLDSGTLFNGNSLSSANMQWLTELGEAYGDYENAVANSAISPSNVQEHWATNNQFVTQIEKASYHVAQTLKSIKAEGYTVITVAWPYYPNKIAHYKITQALMAWIQTDIGEVIDYAQISASDVFDQIEADILCLMQDGKVTDYIGSSFDLQPDSFTLYLGGFSQTRTTLATNQYGFGTPDAVSGEYPFVVTYDPNNAAGPVFVWEINVPVDRSVQVKLDYTLTLKRSTTVGSYIVPANESATLEYTDLKGSLRTGVFEVPMIKYKVGDDPVATTAATTAPKTGDSQNIGLYVAGMVACFALAAGGALLMTRVGKE